MEARLTTYFNDVKPSDVKNIPELMAKYAGREPVMMQALELKYGQPVPAPMGGGDNPVTPPLTFADLSDSLAPSMPDLALDGPRAPLAPAPNALLLTQYEGGSARSSGSRLSMPTLGRSSRTTGAAGSRLSLPNLGIELEARGNASSSARFTVRKISPVLAADTAGSRLTVRQTAPVLAAETASSAEFALDGPRAPLAPAPSALLTRYEDFSARSSGSGSRLSMPTLGRSSPSGGAAGLRLSLPALGSSVRPVTAGLGSSRTTGAGLASLAGSRLTVRQTTPVLAADTAGSRPTVRQTTPAVSVVTLDAAGSRPRAATQKPSWDAMSNTLVQAPAAAPASARAQARWSLPSTLTSNAAVQNAAATAPVRVASWQKRAELERLNFATEQAKKERLEEHKTRLSEQANAHMAQLELLEQQCETLRQRELEERARYVELERLEVAKAEQAREVRMEEHAQRLQDEAKTHAAELEVKLALEFQSVVWEEEQLLVQNKPVSAMVNETLVLTFDAKEPLGFSIADLSNGKHGISIVREGSQAETLGMCVGDMVVSIGDDALNGVHATAAITQHLRDAIAKANAAGEAFRVTIERDAEAAAAAEELERFSVEQARAERTEQRQKRLSAIATTHVVQLQEIEAAREAMQQEELREIARREEADKLEVEEAHARRAERQRLLMEGENQRLRDASNAAAEHATVRAWERRAIQEAEEGGQWVPLGDALPSARARERDVLRSGAVLSTEETRACDMARSVSVAAFMEAAETYSASTGLVPAREMATDRFRREDFLRTYNPSWTASTPPAPATKVVETSGALNPLRSPIPDAVSKMRTQAASERFQTFTFDPTQPLGFGINDGANNTHAIVSVRDGTQAGMLGLNVGDVVVSIGGDDLNGIHDLTAIANHLREAITRATAAKGSLVLITERGQKKMETNSVISAVMSGILLTKGESTSSSRFQPHFFTAEGLLFRYKTSSSDHEWGGGVKIDNSTFAMTLSEDGNTNFDTLTVCGLAAVGPAEGQGQETTLILQRGPGEHSLAEWMELLKQKQVAAASTIAASRSTPPEFALDGRRAPTTRRPTSRTAAGFPIISRSGEDWNSFLVQREVSLRSPSRSTTAIRASTAHAVGTVFVSTASFVPNREQLMGGALAFVEGQRFHLLTKLRSDDDPWLHMEVVAVAAKRRLRGHIPRFHVVLLPETRNTKFQPGETSSAYLRACKVNDVATKLENLTMMLKRQKEERTGLIVGSLVRGVESYRPSLREAQCNVVPVEIGQYYRVLQQRSVSGWIIVGNISGHAMGYVPASYVVRCPVDMEAFATQKHALEIEAALAQSHQRRGELAAQLGEWTDAYAKANFTRASGAAPVVVEMM